jgi:pimeloyl-ACP methyl ester carboxylesterase
MNIQPMKVDVPQEVLDDLKERLLRVRWPNEIPDLSWDYGTNLGSMKQLVAYWLNEYDWRAEERRLNQFSHYKADVGGLGIHFIREKGQGPEPMPLLMMHGYPRSFTMLLKIISMLTDPVAHGGDPEDAFTAVAPSLIGFGLSGPPMEQGFGFQHHPEKHVKLMTEGLGYQRYGIEGGDRGGFITAPCSYLRIPPDSPPVGEEIPVGTLLAYLVESGEAAPFETKILPSPPTSTSATPQQAPFEREPPSTRAASAQPVPIDAAAVGARSDKPAVSPRARRVAAELGIDWTRLKGNGRTGRIVERDVRQAAQVAEQAAQIKISPVARRLAEEAGLDLAELATQKASLGIQRDDVEAAIRAQAVATVPSPASPTVGEAMPITQIRRVIAQRMVESAHTTAPVTLTTEADATELVALREQLKATLAPRDKSDLEFLLARSRTFHPSRHSRCDGG